MADEVLALLVIAVASFVPALLFLGGIRRRERYGREPWHRVFRTFLWGAIFAVIVAVILSIVFFAVFQEVDQVYILSGRFPNLELILLAIVIAPITEEFAKGLGVYLARRAIDEPEDGLVYGAAAGFGFAATENVLYGVAALVATGSLGGSLVVVGVRSVSSALLHASASATFGYGIALRKLRPAAARAFPYFLLAVAMHASFNFLASLGELMSDTLGEAAFVIGLAGAILFAFLAFSAIRAKITAEDRRRAAW